MTAFPYNYYAESLNKWLNPYTCYTQYRAAVYKHLVASKQGSAVSPEITRRDPRVYVEVSRSFSYLWAPVYIKSLKKRLIYMHLLLYYVALIPGPQERRKLILPGSVVQCI